MSITAPPSKPSNADDADRAAAWYAASRQRLGVSQDEWYTPAVDRVLAAISRGEPLAPTVAQFGDARGNAGFDLRETVTDLAALAEVLPPQEAGRLHDLGTTAALTSWADAFIDRVHSPECIDTLTGLATLGYLRARLDEIYRAAGVEGWAPGERHALVVVRARPRSVSPLIRLAARIQAARVVQAAFPGGETVAGIDPSLLVALVARDDQLERTLGRLRTDLEAQSILRPDPDRTTCRIEALPADREQAHALLDRVVAPGSRGTPDPGAGEARSEGGRAP